MVVWEHNTPKNFEIWNTVDATLFVNDNFRNMRIQDLSLPAYKTGNYILPRIDFYSRNTLGTPASLGPGFRQNEEPGANFPVFAPRSIWVPLVPIYGF